MNKDNAIFLQHPAMISWMVAPIFADNEGITVPMTHREMHEKLHEMGQLIAEAVSHQEKKPLRIIRRKIRSWLGLRQVDDEASERWTKRRFHQLLRRLHVSIEQFNITDPIAFRMIYEEDPKIFKSYLYILLIRFPSDEVFEANLYGLKRYGKILKNYVAELESIAEIKDYRNQHKNYEEHIYEIMTELRAIDKWQERYDAFHKKFEEISPEIRHYLQADMLIHYELMMRKKIAEWIMEQTKTRKKITPERGKKLLDALS